MMWLFITLCTMACAAGFFLYLVTRFAKLRIIQRLAGRSVLRYAIASGLLLLLTAFFTYVWDMVNAIVILLHLGVIWMLCDGVSALICLWKRRAGERRPNRYAGTAAILMTISYVSFGWYLAHHVWVREYRIQTEKTEEELTIVQFADSHLGITFHGEGFLQQVQRMQELHPDVVLITGDYVDDDTSREDMIACCEALGTLQTTYGVYFSFGNHDKGYYGSEYRGFDSSDLIMELEKNGVRVLQDEAVLLGDGFCIIGRKDRSEEQMGGSRASMEELMAGIDPDKYIIVMDHQPNDYENQEKAGADLVLSGHTHGGQFLPVKYVGEWIGANDKTYGMEQRGDTTFIVTSGISDWSLRFRTGCRSEIVVIHIE